MFVRRLASLLTVIVLAVCFSGATGLIVPEPCSLSESGSEDASCPPTCAQCGCCAQPVVPIDAFVERADDVETATVAVNTSSRSKFSPADVFHVPKSLLA